MRNNSLAVALLRHHMWRAREGKPYKAFRNCHADGLHSIVLHDETSNRVRIFYATANHSLWRNRAGHTFSVAIHPHHCDIQLIGLFGKVMNDTYALVPNPNGDFYEQEYQSAITTGTGKMVMTGRRCDPHLIRGEDLENRSVYMPAYQLHSIYVPPGKPAAWMVIEGAEDPAYVSTCWTNDKSPDFTGLYVPMDPEEVEAKLQAILDQMESPTA